MRKDQGHSLVELLVVLAIIGMVVGIALPSFPAMRSRAAVRAASVSMRSIFHLARSRAIARGANCGVRFERIAGQWVFSLYDDGDGDGIRTEDIRRRIDTRATEPRVVLPESPAVTIGLLPRSIRDPDGDRLLPSRSPVQFGRSSICSFSPMGESTPGTVYLVAHETLWAVRVYGASAKMRLLRYDEGTRRWVP